MTSGSPNSRYIVDSTLKVHIERTSLADTMLAGTVLCSALVAAAAAAPLGPPAHK
eukprot:COSAG02_NODE_117_length_35386_cov_78.819163_17_plen_55_part_00